MAAAAELGCSYGHLLMVLKNIRWSSSLMRRYRALKAEQSRAAKTTKKSKKKT
jgi:molybdenum-dependent DNA-binding transcriptional regulator ModE